MAHPPPYPGNSSISDGTGLGVFCLYAVTALAAGFILISQRDA
jgi:hypothetical protein